MKILEQALHATAKRIQAQSARIELWLAGAPTKESVEHALRDLVDLRADAVRLKQDLDDWMNEQENK